VAIVKEQQKEDVNLFYFLINEKRRIQLIKIKIKIS
jgi:hypothetical protein